MLPRTDMRGFGLQMNPRRGISRLMPSRLESLRTPLASVKAWLKVGRSLLLNHS